MSAVLPDLARLPLGPLERAMAGSLQRLEPEASPWVLLAAALCCEALARGDVCLPLSRLAEVPGWLEQPALAWPDLASWRQQLAASSLVGQPGEYRPLILELDRLYLARYQGYEQALARRLLALDRQTLAVDEAVLDDSLGRLFQGRPAGADLQRTAVAQAVRRPLAVISGGPGTGKTTTVVRLLAALLEQPGHGPLAIGLAAPTGKAAARMAEAIRKARSGLQIPEALQARLPDQAQTLHRLIGIRGDSTRPRHHAGRPLPLDVLVVDEASMVDLALMYRVVDALPPGARLVLLGDQYQLAAVEAGAVFAEICSLHGTAGPAAPSLGDAVVLLTHSYRFAGDSGIGELARQINAGHVPGIHRVLRAGGADLGWNPSPRPDDLLERLEQGYIPYLQAAVSGEPGLAFAAFNAFRALAARREGSFGVQALNEALEIRLRRRLGLASRERWYPGRAVMVQHNDYALELFNGDVGLCLPTPQGLRVFFEAGQGYRSFAATRLPLHECALVMTVHKSQGSEFDEVLLILPEQPGPLLTRSLLYTGVTRARKRVELWALPERLDEAASRPASPVAGLAGRLMSAVAQERCRA